MLDKGDAKIQIDQDDLETVIPKVGGAVRVVNGRGRRSSAVESIDVDATASRCARRRRRRWRRAAPHPRVEYGRVGSSWPTRRQRK